MSKFEKKFGKYAIHNLTMVLIIFQKAQETQKGASALADAPFAVTEKMHKCS